MLCAKLSAKFLNDEMSLVVCGSNKEQSHPSGPAEGAEQHPRNGAHLESELKTRINFFPDPMTAASLTLCSAPERLVTMDF